MTATPSTPAELFAMNDKPETPYDRPVVEAAMKALSPDNGGTLGDLQAVAEICISILKSAAKEDSNDDDKEWAEISAQMHDDLRIAETFLEKVAYIHMNDED